MQLGKNLIDGELGKDRATTPVSSVGALGMVQIFIALSGFMISSLVGDRCAHKRIRAADTDDMRPASGRQRVRLLLINTFG